MLNWANQCIDTHPIEVGLGIICLVIIVCLIDTMREINKHGR